jgi:hypothetical protein
MRPFFALSVFLAACAHNHSDELHEVCAEIVETCHEAEEVSEDPAIVDCHDVGHDNDEATCTEQSEACLTLCEGALAEAG